jgi:phosphoribosylaminoimidazole carboxylase (NCAIR synthetase)
MRIASPQDLVQASAIFRGRRCVVEQWVDFEREISVICARTQRGETRAFPVSENIHTNHILDLSIVPARISAEIDGRARALAVEVAERLGVVGLVAVEMFLATWGEVLVNEIAPRPHNSGHWTMDGCETSQFEQHVRAICGLPLGPTAVRSPTVMVNILGDAWRRPGGAPGRAEGETPPLRETRAAARAQDGSLHGPGAEHGGGARGRPGAQGEALGAPGHFGRSSETSAFSSFSSLSVAAMRSFEKSVSFRP